MKNIALIVVILAAIPPVAAQFAPADPIQVQQQIDQLKLRSGQANDQARQLDQSAANEDRLAQTGPTWARAIHAGAAITFRMQASQLRRSAQELLTQAQEFERQTVRQDRKGTDAFKVP